MTFDTISNRSNTRGLISLGIIRYRGNNTILHYGLFPFIRLLIRQTEVEYRCEVVSIES